MWVALQKDMEMEVKNTAECLLEDDRTSSSETATIPVEVPGEEVGSVEGAEVARVTEEGAAASVTEENAAEQGAMQEVDGVEGVSEDNGLRPGAEGIACEVNATMPDSLQDDDSALRAGLGDALRGPVPEGEVGGNDTTADPDESRRGTNESECGAGRAVHEAGNEEECHAMDVVEGEPYVVPPAWARVLRAWNDPAIGAGLPDSVLSCGEFQHGTTDEELAHSGEAETVEIATMAASSRATGSGLRSSTEGSDEAESAPKQTNLKGWLKKG